MSHTHEFEELMVNLEWIKSRMSKDEIKAAKKWGIEHGYRGDKGGWIRDRGNKTICQGWFMFAHRWKNGNLYEQWHQNHP